MCIREYLIIIWYGFKLYVVEKKHFTTSQHFFQQTRSFRWSGTKFWCFFFFGFLTIFDSFILTRLQGLPTNRKGFTTFGWDPRMDLPNSFHCKKNDVFPVLLLQSTGCKKQEIPAKFGHLCKAKLELLVPFFPCHGSITPRSMAVGPSWASPKCLANQAWTLKFCCFDGMRRVRVLSCWKVLAFFWCGKICWIQDFRELFWMFKTAPFWWFQNSSPPWN